MKFSWKASGLQMSIGGFLLRNSNTEATSLVTLVGKLTLSPVETLDHSNNNMSAGERVEIRDTLAQAVVKEGVFPWMRAGGNTAHETV